MIDSTFDQAVEAFETSFGNLLQKTQSNLRTEAYVEGLRDWSPISALDDVKTWFQHHRDHCPMSVADIPLAECRGWSLDPETGWIRHDRGDFFYVQGLRISTSGMREVSSGWDQPMLTQVGYDGGILGLLRKRIDGVPMYLIEAKVEPGNYALVQMSPTIQATFANIRQAHGGRAPHFADYFLNPGQHGCKVHFDQWLSEDGGRLTNKRNRGMLIEAPAEQEIPLPNDAFRWLSLWQIKECLHENAWVNPHIRGILAHI
jgi:dTDP-4-dehydro-6-deoxy-alpha-D-glucopyranose 2,3-dehydratase